MRILTAPEARDLNTYIKNRLNQGWQPITHITFSDGVWHTTLVLYGDEECKEMT